MKITFDTAKELNKYLPIETENVVIEGNHYGTALELYGYNSNTEQYPAPTLEELLVNSPIDLQINVELAGTSLYRKGLYREFYINGKKLPLLDSLTEAVAKIIIEYYKQDKT